MASSRAALWAAAVDGGFSKGEAFVSQMPDGKNPENPGFSWALLGSVWRVLVVLWALGPAGPGSRAWGSLAWGWVCCGMLARWRHGWRKARGSCGGREAARATHHGQLSPRRPWF